MPDDRIISPIELDPDKLKELDITIARLKKDLASAKMKKRKRRTNLSRTMRNTFSPKDMPKAV